ncbi:MAG: hypothetical protein IK055_04170 [Lachnospiraceae bacterium]|nr:hypothetical protein [Lachnospiraceae bacterium]
MKSKAMKLMALCLSVVLMFGTVGCAVMASGENGTKSAEVTENSNRTENADAAEDDRTAAVQTAKVDADTVPGSTDASKEETVYVIAGADGSVKKIIVSDLIRNVSGEAAIKDRTNLSDVTVEKGDATYTLGGDGSCVWDTAGNDVYYQGNISGEVPVNVKISYQLDGKSVTPEELKGKSGKVTIRFDYENNQYETVKIDDREEKVYVPFAMLTGMMLDNTVFSNITVSNGKLVNDGSRTIVVGLAFPGLQEDLGIRTDLFEIPNHVEITADVKNFALGMTVTVATNELFNEIDPKKLDSVNALNGVFDQLSEAMGQLTDGSSKLYDGLCTLLDRSSELVAGIDKLAAGAGELKKGAADLDGGVGQLKNGIDKLSDGLATLSSKNDALNGGAEEIFRTLLSTAKTQLTAAGLDVPDMTPENYAKVLDQVIASLDKDKVYAQALKIVTDEVEAKKGYITEQVTAAVRAQVEERVKAEVRAEVEKKVTAAVQAEAEKQAAAQNAAAQMSPDAVKALIASKTDEQMESDEVKAIIAGTVDQKMNSDEIKAVIAQNIADQSTKAVNDAMAGEEVQSKLAAASAGAQQVASLKASLDSYNEFYRGLTSYTAGVEQAANGSVDLKTGAGKLKDGSAALSAGAAELCKGILTLKDGTPALVEGITKLRDGSMTLSDGLKEFNEKGVQRLVDAVEGNLAGLVARMKATIDVSRDYYNYAGIADGMDGQVKFIYRTDEIE